MNTNVLRTPSPVSMTHSEESSAKPRKGWASRFAGVWKDSRSAEEIVEEIRAARIANTFENLQISVQRYGFYSN